MTELTGEGGKGSSQRSYSVAREVFDLRYAMVWGTPEEKAKAKRKLIEMGEVKGE